MLCSLASLSTILCVPFFCVSSKNTLKLNAIESTILQKKSTCAVTRSCSCIEIPRARSARYSWGQKYLFEQPGINEKFRQREHITSKGLTTSYSPSSDSLFLSIAHASNSLSLSFYTEEILQCKLHEKYIFFYAIYRKAGIKINYFDIYFIIC